MPHDTIWKFELELTRVQTVEMPASSEIISVQVQRGIICVWAKVSMTASLRPRLIYIFGTGHPILEPVKHLETVQIGDFVWHVFDGGQR